LSPEFDPLITQAEADGSTAVLDQEIRCHATLLQVSYLDCFYPCLHLLDYAALVC
jgi:hypothetical protein